MEEEVILFFVGVKLIHGVIKQVFLGDLLIFTSSNFFYRLWYFVSLLEDMVMNKYEDSHYSCTQFELLSFDAASGACGP